MNKVRRIIGLLLLMLAVCPLARATGALLPDDTQPFISPNEIHEGMVGYGKTVFHGNKIETFKVVVLGILRKELSGTDVILVKVISPYLKRHHIGLVAGMSGSPVYFQGKLAGAIALGWPFTSEPVAGVIPIQAMLKGTKDTMPSTLSDSNQTIGRHGKNFQSLQPMEIPVSASGFDAAELNEIKTMFPMFQIVPGGAKMNVKTKPAVEPGQSIGAALMEGDFNIIATGTLTYMDHSRVLAFGHPFLFLGDVQLPLMETYVHYVLPSMQLPEKMASPIQDIGKISQDRLYGIGGTLGQYPAMVPMDISITDQDRDTTRQFHVAIAHHPAFTAHLATVALEQAIQATTKSLGGATAHLDYWIYFEHYPPIHRQGMAASDQSIASEVNNHLLKILQDILNNDFNDVRLSKIKVNVSIEQKQEVSVLQQVILNKNHLKPGEPLTITAVLKPYNQSPVKKTFTIPLPSDLEGKVTVGVAGGTGDSELQRTMQEPLPDPVNVRQIVRQAQEAPSDNDLIIRVAYPRKSVSLSGEYLNGMPQPYMDLLKAADTKSPALHADGFEARHEMPWIIDGNITKEFTVEGKKTVSEVEDKSDFLPSGGAEAPSEVPGAASETALTNTIVLSSLDDWQAGTLKNLSVSPEGSLLVGPNLHPTTAFQKRFLWCETRAGDSIYVGSANPGKIYRIGADGRQNLFFDPESAAVTGLAALPNGGLLAGTTGGKLYWLDAQGKIKFEWRLSEDYVWAILPFHHWIYVATGNPQGKIYRLDASAPKPQPELYYTSTQSHILSLYAFKDGRLCAGTANLGLVIEIDPDKNAQIAADVNESAILSLTGDTQNNLYIGTGGKGNVYRLTSSGKLQEFGNFPEQNITWLGMQNNNLLAATGIPARLYSLQPNGKSSLLWSGKSGEAVNLRGGSGSFITSGNHAGVFDLTQNASGQGEYLSPAFDMTLNPIFGRLQWFGYPLSQPKTIVQTRSGNTPEPDSSWSAWSSPYPADGSSIASPPRRYLQVRVALTADAAQTPRLDAVKFFWHAASPPPAISMLTPENGHVIGPKSELKGKIMAPGGAAIKLVLTRQTGLKTEKIVEKLVAVAPDKNEEDFTIPLNTIHPPIPDGPLSLRLTASNPQESNSETSPSSEAIIKALVFDASLPQIEILKMDVQGESLEITGAASDSSSYIKEVDVRANPADPWNPAVSSTGLFDSPKVTFRCALDIHHPKEIEIRAVDAADNETILKKKI